MYFLVFCTRLFLQKHFEAESKRIIQHINHRSNVRVPRNKELRHQHKEEEENVSKFKSSTQVKGQQEKHEESKLLLVTCWWYYVVLCGTVWYYVQVHRVFTVDVMLMDAGDEALDPISVGVVHT